MLQQNRHKPPKSKKKAACIQIEVRLRSDSDKDEVMAADLAMVKSGDEDYNATTLDEDYDATTLDEDYDATTLDEDYDATTLDEDYDATSLDEDYDATTLAPSDCIIVMFVSKKAIHHYVGIIVESTDEFAEQFGVTFMTCSKKSATANRFTIPDEEEIIHVPFDNIMARLFRLCCEVQPARRRCWLCVDVSQ